MCNPLLCFSFPLPSPSPAPFLCGHPLDGCARPPPFPLLFGSPWGSLGRVCWSVGWLCWLVGWWLGGLVVWWAGWLPGWWFGRFGQALRLVPGLDLVVFWGPFLGRSVGRLPGSLTLLLWCSAPLSLSLSLSIIMLAGTPTRHFVLSFFEAYHPLPSNVFSKHLM